VLLFMTVPTLLGAAGITLNCTGWDTENGRDQPIDLTLILLVPLAGRCWWWLRRPIQVANGLRCSRRWRLLGLRCIFLRILLAPGGFQFETNLQ